MESLDAANNSEVCVDAANLTEDEDINLGKPGILELGTQDGDKMDFTLSFLDELIYKDLCQVKHSACTDITLSYFVYNVSFPILNFAI